MKSNSQENFLVLNQNNTLSGSCEVEENEFRVDNFIIEKLPPDESLKRKLDFEREAMPHIKVLSNYAFKISGNQIDADALLQDTFISAFRFFNKFEEGTNCKAWLGRIMRNCYINKYRIDMKRKNN